MTHLFENIKKELKENPIVRRNELLIIKLIIAWLVIVVVILLKINYGMAQEIIYLREIVLNNNIDDTFIYNITLR